MATADVQITIKVDAAPFIEAADKAAEEAAKFAWEAFQPEEGTIEWYDKYFIDYADLGSPTTRPNYYRGVMAVLAEWRKEREEFGDDDAWLSILRENWEQCEEDTAEFVARVAAEHAAALTALQTKYQAVKAEDGNNCLHHQTYYHREWSADVIITTPAGTFPLCTVCAVNPEVQKMLDGDSANC